MIIRRQLMLHRGLPVLIGLFLATAGMNVTSVAGPTPEDPFRKGIKMAVNGDRLDVLDYWESVYDSMSEEGRHDPRIAFRYVEWAVAEQESDRYQKATEIYDWGLQGSLEERYYEEVERQVRMIEPLLDQDTERRWQELLEQYDDRLFREMRYFWDSKDLIPSTTRNERLIEHWARIRSARNQFIESEETVYGTDERGLIYVRLGPPDRHRAGMLTHNATEVRNRLYDLVDVGVIGHNRVFTIQMDILQNFNTGRYEFWRYDGLSEEGPVIYLFGQPGHSGTFRLLGSLEDFISPTVYRSVAVGRRGSSSALRKGYFLQFMLYNQMSTVDQYFGVRLQNYERKWYNAITRRGIQGNWLGSMISRESSASDMRRIQQRAPESISTIDRQLQNYPLTSREYRFLDDDGAPVSSLYAASTPDIPISYYLDELQLNKNEAVYILKQGFRMFHDREQSDVRIKEQQSHINRLIPEKGVVFTGGEVSVNEHVNMEARLFSELYLRSGSEEERGDDRMIGLSSKWTKIGEPLRNNGSLLLSDLVLGSPERQPVRVRNEEPGLLPENNISTGENLQVYFEVYNLEPDEQEEHRYRISYELGKKQRRWFRSSFSADVSLSWEAASGHASDHQFFEVDLSETESGEHRLRISVKDLVAEKQYDRQVILQLEQ